MKNKNTLTVLRVHAEYRWRTHVGLWGADDDEPNEQFP